MIGEIPQAEPMLSDMAWQNVSLFPMLLEQLSSQHSYILLLALIEGKPKCIHWSGALCRSFIHTDLLFFIPI